MIDNLLYHAYMKGARITLLLILVGSSVAGFAQTPVDGLMPQGILDYLKSKKDNENIWSWKLWAPDPAAVVSADKIRPDVVKTIVGRLKTTMRSAFVAEDPASRLFVLSKFPSPRADAYGFTSTAKDGKYAWFSLGWSFGVLYLPEETDRVGDMESVRAHVLESARSIFRVEEVPDFVPVVSPKPKKGFIGLWTGSLEFAPGMHDSRSFEDSHWYQFINFVTDGRAIFFEFFGDPQLMGSDRTGGAQVAGGSGG